MGTRWRVTMIVFFVVFAATMASIAYFASQRVPLARCLDPDRSSLTALAPPGQGVEVRVMVLQAAKGQVRARYEPPQRPGAVDRVVVEWVARPDPGGDAADAKDASAEQLLTVALPYTLAVDVIDTRGPFPERLPLRLLPDGSR